MTQVDCMVIEVNFDFNIYYMEKTATGHNLTLTLSEALYSVIVVYKLSLLNSKSGHLVICDSTVSWIKCASLDIYIIQSSDINLHKCVSLASCIRKYHSRKNYNSTVLSRKLWKREKGQTDILKQWTVSDFQWLVQSISSNLLCQLSWNKPLSISCLSVQNLSGTIFLHVKSGWPGFYLSLGIQCSASFALLDSSVCCTWQTSCSFQHILSHFIGRC